MTPNSPNVDHRQHLRTALLAYTIEALVDGLGALARDPETCVEFGRKGRKHIDQCFSPTAVERRVRKNSIERMWANNDRSAELVPAPPVTDDLCELTSRWIEEFRKAERLPYTADGSDALDDNFSQEVRRMQNRFANVNQVDWGTAAKVVFNRLHKGQLGRTLCGQRGDRQLL